MLNSLCIANSTGGDMPLLSHPPILLVLTAIGRQIRGQRKTLKEGGLSPLHFSNVDTFQYALDNEKMQLEGFRNTVSQKFQIFQGKHTPDPPRWLLALAFEAQLIPTSTSTVVEHSLANR